MHARRNHANAHLAGMPSPYLNHRLAFVVPQRIHRNMAWHRFSEFVAVEVECSLVFFRLIERLAIGADDDHPQALFTKALGALLILSFIVKSCG
jgi:hypothetical protein